MRSLQAEKRSSLRNIQQCFQREGRIFHRNRAARRDRFLLIAGGMIRPAFSRFSNAVLTTLAALIFVVGVVRAQAPAGNAAAKKIKNPVPSTPASIAAGKATYETYCTICHGVDAKGNGPMAPPGTNPPNLVDETWIHGSTDGEIFSVIANGTVPPTTMAGFKTAIQEKEIWNVVNYLRSIGPKNAVR